MKTGILLVTIYLLLMGFISFKQERLMFFPEKLPVNYGFSFKQEFEEIFIPATDGVLLHGVLFSAPSSKGLVLYLHGNAGSVDMWGWIAETYTGLKYDVFVLDYRGYGKSEGEISSESQFYSDAQSVYDILKTRYNEADIIIAGYSIGSAAAAKLAAENKPKLLILQAPFYSLSDLAQSLYPIIPTFLLKYKFETFRFVQQTKAPIVLFHGELDEIIYPGSSEKLKPHLKPSDRVIILKGQGHNGMNNNPAYQRELARLLARFDKG